MVYVLLYALLVTLPFQVRWIFVQSAKQYTTLSLYAFDIIYVALLVVFIVWWYQHWKMRLPRTFVALSGGVAVLVFLSAYWSLDRQVSLYYWIRLVEGISLVWIIIALKPSVKIILHLLVINGLIQSAFVIWQTISQHVVGNKWLGMATQLPELVGTPVVLTETGRFLRAFGTLPHPNITGGLLLISLVSALMLWRMLLQSKEHHRYSALKRYYVLIATAVLSLSLLLTFSRSALLVWGVIIAAVTIIRYQVKIVALVSLTTLLIAAIIYSPLLTTRWQISNYVEINSWQDRSSQYSQAWKMWPRYWLPGTGIGNYTLVANQSDDQTNDAAEQNNTPTQPLHATPWLIFMEIGAGAGIVFAWLFGWAIRRTRWRDPDACGLTLLLLAIIATSLFDHYFWTIPSMFLMWMLVLGLQISSNLNNVHSG